MRTDIVRDYSYTATDQERLWREKLGRVADHAMAYSEDLVGAVIVYQRASLAAVDVTWGVASHADLRDAAQEALDGLADFVNVEPMRRALRDLITEIDAELLMEMVTHGDPVAKLPVAENALEEGGDPPRKQRAA